MARFASALREAQTHSATQIHPHTCGMDALNNSIAFDNVAGQQGALRRPLPAEINAVPEFSGDRTDKREPRQWLEILDQYATMWSWSEADRIRVARTRLIGPAYHWMSSVPNNITWQQFLDEFLSRFAEPQQAALTRLSNCDQDEYESVDSYADRFRRDMHLSGTQEDDAMMTHCDTSL